jgi:hypothetical protein
MIIKGAIENRVERQRGGVLERIPSEPHPGGLAEQAERERRWHRDVLRVSDSQGN